jgi:hypothetical protein
MSGLAPQDELLAELLALAEGLGIEVRRSAMGGDGGGLAVLRGKRILFVDSEAPPEVQLERSAGGLARLSNELESIYIKPALRAMLDMEPQTE